MVPAWLREQPEDPVRDPAAPAGRARSGVPDDVEQALLA